ncbi:hypothetical protein GRS48_11580 [Halorubrum sp. JWXQ-INN 858]|uniref:hypothetical protein n=1 Tax=Halorubrum sp. JWXQ-INN 858 TaxID=2690782 RepID=UPI001358F50F|nr:hypothetical protein [Halorubrum sp. JWXQ-INN 858]MWV65452.1 hypothetical protein [Halorubrum sp. JWXQ-INN 858]
MTRLSAEAREFGSDVAERVLLRTNRWALILVVLAVVFIALVSLSQVGLTPLRTIVENQNGIGFFFSAFIGTIVTGTAIVVTINQLVLAQELGAVGDQHERMQGSMAFQREVEAEIGDGVSPTDPATFLSYLADAIGERVTVLHHTVTEGDARSTPGAGPDTMSDGPDGSDDVDNVDSVDDIDDVDDMDDVDDVDEILAYGTVVRTDVQALKKELTGAEFGTFDVIWGALEFDYSRRLHTARRLRHEHADRLSSDALDALEDVITLLELFGPTREHIKTLYFQWELIDLSRALLYVSIPALAVTAAMNMYVDGNTFPGTVLGVDNLVWVTSAAFVVGISPFVVFTAYVLRIATVAKRTLAIGPLILDTGSNPD